jgi:cell wall-associated NlpC family hydrolase
MLARAGFRNGPDGVLAALNSYNTYTINPWWRHDILFWAEKYAAGGPGTGGTATVDGSTCTVDAGQLQKVVDFVREQVRRGIPYVYGAVGPDAYDCSSLMVAAYRQIGVTLPRTTAPQADSGLIEIVKKAPITGPDGLQPGDLLFIDTNSGLDQNDSKRLGRNNRPGGPRRRVRHGPVDAAASAGGAGSHSDRVSARLPRRGRVRTGCRQRTR